MGRRKERGLSLKKTFNSKNIGTISSVYLEGTISNGFFPHKRVECFVFNALPLLSFFSLVIFGRYHKKKGKTKKIKLGTPKMSTPLAYVVAYF